MTDFPALALKRNEDKRLRAGHLWVFSNEIDTQRSPMSAFEAGQPADVVDHQGRNLGTALVNPKSLICARLISRQAGTSPSQRWFANRLERAAVLRKQAGLTDAYRWVYGESDGLPGLVIDRFDAVVVGQLNTAGMDRLRPVIEEALMSQPGVEGVLWRNDAQVRELEGLEREVLRGPGSIPDAVRVDENGLFYELSLTAGQKTGWYFDQRANRERVTPLLGRCRRVLDLFSYHGAWGLAAARAGAAEVCCVDSSESAIAALQAHAGANGLADRVSALQTDAERYLDEQLEERARFDAIVFDPPAFAPRARDVRPALKAYRRMNEKALRLLNPGGLLVSMTCSAHIREDRYEALLLEAARHIDRELQVLMRLEQGPDHPVHPAIPETRYLKGRVVRVLSTA
ncbi:MAG: class I SAM-dependent rRNA methyltransferase [Halieaceae bacterium]|jgi:23S rRNA (cytosine1962-C5)-methyltransferase|nr:class I SAM-dependent rRNA methyltransferase [Halieaceae bacterium]